MATIATLSKTRSHAAGSPRRHPQLLPHQSTLRNGGSHQRQHQNPSEKGPRLQESGLSAAQGPTHGGHQDRIHRPSESRLKCGSLQILVQSQINHRWSRHIPLPSVVVDGLTVLWRYRRSYSSSPSCNSAGIGVSVPKRPSFSPFEPAVKHRELYEPAL